jgi:type IX secretion system PorP/SprF family membrane protein
MKKLICSLVVICYLAGNLSAQQIANWSSYYENGLMWNPALTAKWMYWEMNATHRTEWSGFEDAPEYGSISYQFPFTKRKTRGVSVGAFAEYDKIGALQNTTFGGTYVYKIRPQLFNKNNDVLSFGLLAKFQQLRINPIKLVHHELLEGDFTDTETNSKFGLNAGFGVFYISEYEFGEYNRDSHFYFGASALNLIPNSITAIEGLKITQIPHFTFNAGYRHYPWNSRSFIETNLLAVYALQRPLNVMANLRYEKLNKYWASVGAVTSGDIFLQVGLIFNEDSFLKKIVRDGSLRLGFKSDYSMGSISSVAGVGYEVYIAYRFKFEN